MFSICFNETKISYCYKFKESVRDRKKKEEGDIKTEIEKKMDIIENQKRGEEENRSKGEKINTHTHTHTYIYLKTFKGTKNIRKCQLM
jgi:hypothetical protein